MEEVSGSVVSCGGKADFVRQEALRVVYCKYLYCSEVVWGQFVDRRKWQEAVGGQFKHIKLDVVEGVRERRNADN